MKLKIYKAFFTILIISAILVTVLIAIKYNNNQKYENDNQQIVEVFSRETVSQEQNIQLEMNGYKVIGTVKIEKINLEYPILDIDSYNPEETKIPMKFSIVKYWGGQVNEYGNLSIAGHNNYDGTMFGKTKKLEIGDIVELTDTKKKTIQYKIYTKFVTDPNDVTILQTKDESAREVTIITCTNGNKERLILKAKEII
ncbi:MAG: sortase [Clostridia bacterium]|nr:sortase [Clostridia bacterium]